MNGTYLSKTAHVYKRNTFPFQGEGRDGGGVSPVDPTPTLALPLKGRGLVYW
jgi:hypothetical protein